MHTAALLSEKDAVPYNNAAVFKDNAAINRDNAPFSIFNV